MRILKGLEKSIQFWFLIFTSFLFFLLRLPSLFEPLWYGDEGIYQVIGTSLNNGKLLYAEIFDNKPPLLYWLYAILQSDQFTIRLTSLIFGIFSVIAFFLLSKKIFEEKKSNNIPILTTFIFAVLFGLPILEGNIANAENFMLLPILIAAFFILKDSRVSTFHLPLPSYHFFLAGLLLGVAFLFKIVAVFDLIAFIIFYLITNFDSQKRYIKIPSLILGFFLPILIVTLFFISNGAFIDFVKAAFLTNISYVNYGNKIGNFPLLLYAKLILLGGFTLFIFIKRKKLTSPIIFVLIWFTFSLFNTFFSQRPYTHYLLVLLPSFSLTIGLIFLDKKYKNITTIFLLIGLIIIIKGFGVPKPNKSIYYYQNFLSFIGGEKTMAQYQKYFDRNTPYDYEIARFIKPKLNKNDTIFVWGNNAQLYQLVGVVAPTKYVVAYHISNYSDGKINMKNGIEKTEPKFIVVMKNQKEIPYPLINYSRKIDLQKAVIYERIF